MICSPTDRALSPQSKEPQHPERVTLERLMRGSLPRADAMAVVRHLLAGCESCREITRRFWDLGEETALREHDEPEEGLRLCHATRWW